MECAAICSDGVSCAHREQAADKKAITRSRCFIVLRARAQAPDTRQATTRRYSNGHMPSLRRPMRRISDGGEPTQRQGELNRPDRNVAMRRSSSETNAKEELGSKYEAFSNMCQRKNIRCEILEAMEPAGAWKQRRWPENLFGRGGMRRAELFRRQPSSLLTLHPGTPEDSKQSLVEISAPRSLSPGRHISRSASSIFTHALSAWCA